MKKISGSTFFFKKFFPVIWFVFLGLTIVVMVTKGADSPKVFSVPIAMIVFGFVILRVFIWDLADEVYDKGDSLKFIRGDQEQSVALKDVVNISYSHMTSPERVVIYTKNEGRIGRKLVFSPPIRLNPFSKSPIVIDLIERVDRARDT